MELLERKTQLDELSGLLRQAASGRGCLLFLGGEAGVGKSSLIRVFSEAARSRCRMLTGACDPLSTPRPHGPLIDMSEHMGSEIASLAASPASRMELFSAVLADLAAETTLMIIEDAHWADEGTLDLLRYLGRRIGHSPALIVVTYRDDEVGTNHPLRRVLGDLVTAEAVRRMGLRPLSLHAVATMVRDTGLDPVAIHRQTNGNPFFITEVVAAGQAELPETVRDAVLARASRLSSDGRGLLDVVAVIGSPAESWLVTQVSTAPAMVVEECIDAGMLLSEGYSLSFRHELARRSVLDSISAPRQIDLNSSVLDALRASGSQNMARLAHHAAASFDRAAVLEYGIAAAENAVSLHAHRQAADQYARVLTFADDLPPRRKGDLLTACATESLMAEDLAAALSSCQQALDIWRLGKDDLREGDELRRLSRILWYSGRNAEAEAAGLEAIALLEQLPPGPELAMAYSNESQLRMLSHDTDAAIRWGEAAIALAEQLGELRTRVHALNNVGSARMMFDVEGGARQIEESLRLALDAGFQDHAARAYAGLGSNFCQVYQFPGADRYLQEGIAYCSEHDLEGSRNYLLAWRAVSLMHQGQWADAETLAQSLTNNPHISPPARIQALAVLGRLLSRKGDIRATSVLDKALELALPTGEQQRLGPVRAARAEAALLASDKEEARNEIRHVYQQTLDAGHVWLAGELGYLLWKAGESPPRSDMLFEPFRLQIAGNWREAAARWRALGCPYETASALADSSEESDLRYALAEFDRLGAAPMAALVSARLRTLTEQRIRHRRSLPSAVVTAPETRYARSGDVHIAYQVVGDGPVDLVFVMGWVSNVERFWEGPSVHFLRRLASFSRLIIFDKRGTGLSDRVVGIPTLEERMDDVRAVMEAVGSSRAALLGISEGASMCALFAATYPERTSALIIYGGFAKRVWAPDYPWAPTAAEREKLLETIEKDWGGPVGLEARAPSVAGDEEFQRWWSTFLRSSASPGAARAISRMNSEIDIRHVLPAIQAPTLILHRTGDRLIEVASARYMAEKTPNAKYVELPGIDHLPFAGDQDSILDEIELFLTGARPVPQADRVLATVVAVEIASAPERVATLPIRQWRATHESFEREVEEGLIRFRGDRAQSTAGGFLAAFDGPGRAIRFAGAIATAAEQLGLQTRAGIHTGECERSEGTLTGLPLHLATTIMAQSAPGGVVVSNIVKDLVAGSGIEFENIGSLLIPDLPGELTLHRVLSETRPQTDFTVIFTQRSKAARDSGPSSRLSRREAEIAILIADGLSNRQIADQLSISPATVERHVSNIFNKLGYHSRAQLAAWVVEHRVATGSE